MKGLGIIDISGDRTRWSEALETFSGAGVGHLHDWGGIIERAYGMKSYYLAAVDGRQVRGLLPIVVLKSRLFGNSIVSMPYLNDGGILAHDKEAETLLWKKAISLMSTERSSSIELRHSHDMNLGVAPRMDKISLILDIGGGTDHVWMKKLHSNVRNKIRKSEKLGVEIKSGPEYLDDFFNMHVVGMQELGSPAHRKDFFTGIINTLKERARVYVAVAEGRVIGGKLVVYFNDTIYFLWVSSPKEYSNYAAVSLMDWRAVTDGIDEGLRFCDFGRSSSGSTQFDFKKKWGADVRQLYWHVYPEPPQAQQAGAPEGKRYDTFIKVWKKLPLSVVRLVGPMLRGGLPQ